MFIYVFNEEAKEKLLSRGYTLLLGNYGTYVFAMKDTYEFDCND